MKPPSVSSSRRGFTTLSALTASALLLSSFAPAFLGAHPGRDRGRGGLWSDEQARAMRTLGRHERLGAGVRGKALAHPLAVAPKLGASLLWEGGTASGVNTGNGNKLTTLPLLSWKVTDERENPIAVGMGERLRGKYGDTRDKRPFPRPVDPTRGGTR